MLLEAWKIVVLRVTKILGTCFEVSEEKNFSMLSEIVLWYFSEESCCFMFLSKKKKKKKNFDWYNYGVGLNELGNKKLKESNF